mmetsp:Transcript_860/g.1275  ORF Transcript_860/g.1275 Transcript_860/m.1275 type:complete len:334 (-) Transcript_860:770-1771(-)
MGSLGPWSSSKLLLFTLDSSFPSFWTTGFPEPPFVSLNSLLTSPDVCDLLSAPTAPEGSDCTSVDTLALGVPLLSRASLPSSPLFRELTLLFGSPVPTFSASSPVPTLPASPASMSVFVALGATAAATRSPRPITPCSSTPLVLRFASASSGSVSSSSRFPPFSPLLTSDGPSSSIYSIFSNEDSIAFASSVSKSPSSDFWTCNFSALSALPASSDPCPTEITRSKAWLGEARFLYSAGSACFSSLCWSPSPLAASSCLSVLLGWRRNRSLTAGRISSPRIFTADLSRTWIVYIALLPFRVDSPLFLTLALTQCTPNFHSTISPGTKHTSTRS